MSGTIYCAHCSLVITRYHKSVRVLRPEGDSENPADYAHWHNREGYNNDCWERTLAAAKVLAAAKKPTQTDMTAFEKFCAVQDAKRATAQGAG